MKTALKTLFILLIFSLTSKLQAQNAETSIYYVIDYMKVEPGMHSSYLKLEAAWKKLHVASKKAGQIEGWALERVVSPTGASAPYNYLTRIKFKNEKQLAAFMSRRTGMFDNLTTLLTAAEIQLVNETIKYRTHVKSEVWSSVDRVMSTTVDEAEISVFNYFDIPAGKNHQDHVKVEKDIWRPIHAARVNDKAMEGWVMLRLQMPFGSSLPYQDATVDIYKDMEQFMTPFFEKYFAKIHSDKNISDLLMQTEAVADLVKGEVRMKILDLK